MDATEVERRGIDPLALSRGFTGLGCEPDEMSNGPVFAVPRPLDRLGLSIDDIDLWEHNEALWSRSLSAVTGSGYRTNG